MARKKIVFVIVEGPSDEEALGVVINRLYDKNAVYVEVTHGDITSRKDVSTENIAARIGDLVRNYAKSNHFKATDFQEVIHLIDMDGAYVPENAVVYDENAEKPFYTENEIRCAKPEQIKERNERKSGNINRICVLGKVWKTIPYRAYYMSSNLDHVLYNKLNSSDQDKDYDAHAFARQYKDQPDKFLEFISDSDFSVRMEFKESWDFIKEEKHSLERHTNLGLCFEKIK